VGIYNPYLDDVSLGNDTNNEDEMKAGPPIKRKVPNPGGVRWSKEETQSYKEGWDDRDNNPDSYAYCYNPWSAVDMVGPGSIFISLATCFTICFIPYFYHIFTRHSASYPLPLCCFIQRQLTVYSPCCLHEFPLHVSDIFIKGQTVYKLG
jgi:hypothetical protein